MAILDAETQGAIKVLQDRGYIPAVGCSGDTPHFNVYLPDGAYEELCEIVFAELRRQRREAALLREEN